jgi:hypothetical protein
LRRTRNRERIAKILEKQTRMPLSLAFALYAVDHLVQIPDKDAGKNEEERDLV